MCSGILGTVGQDSLWTVPRHSDTEQLLVSYVVMDIPRSQVTPKYGIYSFCVWITVTVWSLEQQDKT